MTHDNIALVYQYRHPIGRRLWELPAGLLDIGGEDPHRPRPGELTRKPGLQRSYLAGARRPGTPRPGFSDESVRVYLATGLTEIDRPEAHDEEADMTLQWYPLDDAVARRCSAAKS